jgi:hypothetical protein
MKSHSPALECRDGIENAREAFIDAVLVRRTLA